MTISNDDLAIAVDAVRGFRNAILAETDWTQAADSPLSDAVKSDYARYRVYLRNLPATMDNADVLAFQEADIASFDAWVAANPA